MESTALIGDINDTCDNQAKTKKKEKFPKYRYHHERQQKLKDDLKRSAQCRCFLCLAAIVLACLTFATIMILLVIFVK